MMVIKNLLLKPKKRDFTIERCRGFISSVNQAVDNTPSKTVVATENTATATTDAKSMPQPVQPIAPNTVNTPDPELEKAKAELEALKAQMAASKSTQQTVASSPTNQPVVESTPAKATVTTDAKSVPQSGQQLAQNTVATPDPELEKAKAELEALKAQMAASKAAENKASADELKSIDEQVAKLRSSSDRIAVQFDGYKQLQDQVKTSFEDKLSLSIKNVETQIAGLSSAKDAAVNAEQIKQLQASLSDLKSKKLADDPTFQSITQKLAAAKKEAADNDAALKAQIDSNKQKLDAQRLSDMTALEIKLGGLNNQMAAYQSKFDADLAAYQSANNQRFSQITASIDTLNARTAELEKNQKTLATNQTNLAVKQANTDARLEGIFLPKSENPPDWISRLSSIPVQQNQFCRIVDRFHDDLANVYKLRNDIKKNALYKDRQQDMAALLPNGAINSWVVRVVEVTQAADGSAAIMLQPPCRAMLGSDACGTDQKKFRATIQPETLMYRELARVNSGDFVTVSGTILYAQTMNTNSALPQYALYEPNKHCSAVDGSKEEDVFVTEISNIALLR